MSPRQREELKRVLTSIERGKDDDEDNQDETTVTKS